MNQVGISPFLKWPGGKRWLASTLLDLLNKNVINRYFEPFLGGGSIFFALNIEQAYLSDSNEQLIITYETVQKFPDEIIAGLRKMPVDKITYNKIRLSEPKNEIEIAVRFLYLNRLAFGGMYRVNKNGKFNVPFGGRTMNPLWNQNLIQNASLKLRNVKLICQDFELAIDQAEKGDLVYCDPPYTVAHNLNGFQRYNEHIFTWEDQMRLKLSCERASKRGAKIIISNAANDSLKDLYSPLSPIVLTRYSGLSSNPAKRKHVEEYLFLYNI